MRLTAVGLFKTTASGEPIEVGFVADLSNFGFFQRGAVRETMVFCSRTILGRTQRSSRQSVKEQDWYCHAFVNKDGLGGVVFVDKDYPARAAYCVVYKAIDDYLAAAGDAWKGVNADSEEANPVLEKCLAAYQDPAAADKLTKVQRELDETKLVLHQTIESVLERGEKLDSLVEKSGDLGIASQLFYKQAKKTNSCCKMM